MSVPIAVLAENKVVGVASYGGELRGAIIADLRAQVLAREQVSGMNLLIAEQTELGGVSSAIQNSCLLGTEIARNAFRAPRFGANHLRCTVMALL